MGRIDEALLSHRFFAACADGHTDFDLRPLLREWYTVSRTFALSSTVYVSTLAEEVLSRVGEDAETLERALLYPLSISYGEFKADDFKPDEIHYNMVAKMASAFGVSRAELSESPGGKYPETAALNREIRDSFRDVGAGAGCFQVVEATGYAVVEGLGRLARRLYERGGDERLRPDNIEYISLHLILEAAHPLMVDELVSLLGRDPRYAERAAESAEKFVRLFGNFWDRMYSVTFVDAGAGGPSEAL